MVQIHSLGGISDSDRNKTCGDSDRNWGRWGFVTEIGVGVESDRNWNGWGL